MVESWYTEKNLRYRLYRRYPNSTMQDWILSWSFEEKWQAEDQLEINLNNPLIDHDDVEWILIDWEKEKLP